MKLVSAVMALLLSGLILPQQILAQEKEKAQKTQVAVVANTGPLEDIDRAVFSPDGRLLATVDDSNARLWDVATGRLLRRLDDKAYIGALLFSPDGRWIVTGHKDGRIALWDLAGGAAAVALQKGGGDDEQAINSLWIDASGGTLVAGSASGIITLWDLAAHKQVDRLEFGALPDPSFQARILAVRLTADRGRLIAVTRMAGRTFDLKTRQRVFSRDLSGPEYTESSIIGERGLLVQGPSEGCYALTFIAFDDPNTAIDVDKPAKCEPGKDSDNTEPAVYAAADGSRLVVTRSGTPELKVWNVQSRQTEPPVRWPDGASSKIVGTSPDLARVATAEGGRIAVRKLETGAALRELASFGWPAESAIASADGKNILMAHDVASASPGQKAIAIWRRGGAEPRMTKIEADKDSVVRDFSPAAGLAAVSNDEKGEIAIVSLDTGKLRNRFTVPDIKSINRLRMSPDGKTLVVIGNDDKDASVTMAVAAADGTVTKRFPGRDRPGRLMASLGKEDESDLVTASAFSPDGRQLALARWNGTAEIWGSPPVRRLSSLPADKENGDQSWSLSFSGDGKWLISGSRNSGVYLWDLARRRLLRTYDYDDYLAGHAHFSSVAIAPDRKLIAAGLGMHAVSSGDTGPEHGIKLWDVATGKLKLTLRGNEGGVGALAFSDTDPWLVSASYDGTLRYWDRTTGKLMATCTTSADGGWLIVTASGFFAGSAGSDAFVSVVSGREARTGAQFRDTLFRPDLVDALLTGDRDGRYRDAAKRLDLAKAWAERKD